MKNLKWISCWLLLSLISCVVSRSDIAPERFVFDMETLSKYKVRIKFEQVEMTGILIFKYEDKEWRGSLINEFGIKAFDFIAPKGKCKLQNTISFLDKWYIRRTVEGDFAFLFWDTAQGKTVKGKSLQRLSEEEWLLKNEKRNIEYSFQKIER
jgi:hypothetical protein